MLAIAAGLVISVIMIPFTHFATTLRRWLAARTIQYRFRVRQKSRRFRTGRAADSIQRRWLAKMLPRRAAANKIRTQFWRMMWKRRYRQQIDGTRDPYSIMGVVTAWDRDLPGRNYYTDRHERSFALNEWGILT